MYIAERTESPSVTLKRKSRFLELIPEIRNPRMDSLGYVSKDTFGNGISWNSQYGYLWN
jgi:hypothetical protein